MVGSVKPFNLQARGVGWIFINALMVKCISNSSPVALCLCHYFTSPFAPSGPPLPPSPATAAASRSLPPPPLPGAGRQRLQPVPQAGPDGWPAPLLELLLPPWPWPKLRINKFGFSSIWCTYQTHPLSHCFNAILYHLHLKRLKLSFSNSCEPFTFLLLQPALLLVLILIVQKLTL